MKKSG